MSHDARLEHDRDALLDRLRDMQTRIEALTSELERSNRLATLGVLAAMIAHEFNNLLTPVQSYAQLALATPSDATLVQKALVRAIEGTEQLARIAKAILGFVREDDQLQDADVNRVVDETLDCMARHPSKMGVTLVRDVPPEMRVAMRPVCLQQIFLNLFLNALEAMRAQQGGELRVTARPQANGRVLLQVSDTGCGVPEDIVDRLFEPLVTRPHGSASSDDGETVGGSRSQDSGEARRLDDTGVAPRRSHPGPNPMLHEATAAAHPSGHGLGLAVCRRLVEEAGGRIAVTSQPGLGTTFAITLAAARTLPVRKSA